VFAFNPLQPVTDAMLGLLNAIHGVIPSYGLDMILLALVVRVALFPLAQQQFKSMAEMQKVQPLLKKIQAEHKGKPQELQAATMALYKEHGVNPLAGCFPMLIQLPILLGLFYAINKHAGCDPTQWDAARQLCAKVAGAAPGDFWSAHFLWIGSALSTQFPPRSTCRCSCSTSCRCTSACAMVARRRAIRSKPKRRRSWRSSRPR